MAAKGKISAFLIVITLIVMTSLCVHPPAASCNIVKSKPHYDFKLCEILKPHYGSSEKILVIELVQNQHSPEKTQGQNDLRLRRLHLAPKMSLYRGYFVVKGVDPFGYERYVISSVPDRSGKGVVLSEDVSGERVIEVDGTVRWRGQMEKGKRVEFDFNWLRKSPGAGFVRIRCPTGPPAHSIKYKATLNTWSDKAFNLTVPLAPIEGVGIITAFQGNATGDYLKYTTANPHSAGPRAPVTADGIWWHSRAAKWDTTIEVSARLIINQKAASAKLFATKAVSLFGAQDLNVEGRPWTGPPSAGRPNSPPRKPDEGFDFHVQYNKALDKWFDTSENLGSLAISMGASVNNETGNTQVIPRDVEFELPPKGKITEIGTRK